MTEYLHHVPGRLRIRSKVFRCNTPSRGQALRKLRTLDGVNTVRLNEKAGSVTVCYDTDVTGPQQVLAFLNACDCMQQPAVIAKSEKKTLKPKSSKKDFNITREVGKIAFNVLVSRGVSASIGALLGARV